MIYLTDSAEKAMETCTYFEEVFVKFLLNRYVTLGRQYHFFPLLTDEYEG